VGSSRNANAGSCTSAHNFDALLHSRGVAADRAISLLEQSGMAGVSAARLRHRRRKPARFRHVAETRRTHEAGQTIVLGRTQRARAPDAVERVLTEHRRGARRGRRRPSRILITVLLLAPFSPRMPVMPSVIRKLTSSAVTPPYRLVRCSTAGLSSAHVELFDLGHDSAYPNSHARRRSAAARSGKRSTPAPLSYIAARRAHASPFLASHARRYSLAARS
jgi:hypothetical protein